MKRIRINYNGKVVKGLLKITPLIIDNTGRYLNICLWYDFKFIKAERTISLDKLINLIDNNTIVDYIQGWSDQLLNDYNYKKGLLKKEKQFKKRKWGK